MTKILSVSVAAYNVEKFIEKNLESFVSSEARDAIEVLVIDDGSKDSTTKIVKKYEKLYPGIVKLIEQKNAGPGSTVNSGIKYATGNFFRMVDGDDWVDTKNLKKYINFLKNNDVDMVVTNYTTVDNETGEEVKKNISGITKNKILEFNSQCNNLSLEMHSVTFKTRILKDNNIILDNGFYTDLEYLLLPTKYINTIAFLDLNIYMYRISLSTQSMNYKSMQKNIKMHEIVLKRLIKEYEKAKSENLEIEKLNYISKRVANMVGTHMAILLSYDNSREYKNELKLLFKYVQDNSDDIYFKFIEKKTAKLLKNTRFNTYFIIAKLFKIKNKIKNK